MFDLLLSDSTSPVVTAAMIIIVILMFGGGPMTLLLGAIGVASQVRRAARQHQDGSGPPSTQTAALDTSRTVSSGLTVREATARAPFFKTGQATLRLAAERAGRVPKRPGRRRSPLKRQGELAGSHGR